MAWRDRLVWIAAILVAAIIAWRTTIQVVANWAFTADDAYITLRYARHLADGHGVVWNIGEAVPVEGYSNFLFVVLGAAAMKLGLDPVLVLKLAGVISLAGTCAMLWWLTRCWVGPLAATLPSVVLVSYPGTLFWATSGLETAVYQFLVVSAVTLFVRAFPHAGVRDGALSHRRLAISGALAFLASITRPEGPLVAIAIGGALGVHLLLRRSMPWADRIRALAWWLVPLAAPYAVYFGWRLIHFGRLLPNSVYCKTEFGAQSMHIFDGYRQLAMPYIAFAIAHRQRDLDARLGAILAVPLLYAFALRDVDPIIGIYNRHALTAWSLILAAAVVGLNNMLKLIPRLPARAAEWIATLIVVLWVRRMVAPPEYLAAHAAGYAERGAGRQRLGQWLRDNVAPGETYVIGDCGVAPYVGGGDAIDAFCLNNGAMTRPPIAGDRARLIEWVYEQRPAVLVVHSSSLSELAPRPEYGFYPALVAHAAFQNYQLETKFDAGGFFNYWVYRRR